MTKSGQIHNRRSGNFLGLALDDYRAARFLLCNGMLAQAAPLAATAVEKYLKSILALKKFHTKKHLESPLFNALKNHYPDLHNRIDWAFMKFLKKCFKLRYASVEGEGYGIILNQHHMLLELDKIVVLIDNGIVISKSTTPLQRAFNSKDPILMDRNVPLGGISSEELVGLNNIVQEILVGPKLDTSTITYETQGMNLKTSWLRKPNINIKKGTIQLSFGR